MTNFATRFFAPKKLGVAMALLASLIALLAVAPFLPRNLQAVFHALSVGFAVGLGGFFRAYSDDVRSHQPLRQEFLSKAFYTAYASFILILITTLIVRHIPNLQ